MSKCVDILERELHFSKIRKEKGITLVALIITIVVILILAGVSVAMMTGENGLLNKAKIAKEEYKNAEIEEEKELYDMTNEIDAIVGTRDEISEEKIREIVIEELNKREENLLDLYDSTEEVLIALDRNKAILRKIENMKWYNTGISVTLVPGSYTLSVKGIKQGRFHLSSQGSGRTEYDSTTLAAVNGSTNTIVFNVTNYTKCYLMYANDVNFNEQIDHEIELRLVRNN